MFQTAEGETVKRYYARALFACYGITVTPPERGGHRGRLTKSRLALWTCPEDGARREGGCL